MNMVEQQTKIKSVKMKMYVLLNLIFLAFHFTNINAQDSLKKEIITAEEMMEWQTLDIGKRTIEDNSIVVEETAGSNGFFLINPKVYHGDVIIKYQVKAISTSSVLITLFSVLDIQQEGQLTLPPENSSGREIWNWRSTLQHYNLTFNNASHGYKPFFYKNLSPRSKGFHNTLSDNITEIGKWYDVEIGKVGERLWFKLNDDLIFDVVDCSPLSSGQLIFRISGSNSDEVIFAKAAFRNLVVFSE